MADSASTYSSALPNGDRWSLLLFFLTGHEIEIDLLNPNFTRDSRTLITGSADASVKLSKRSWAAAGLPLR